MIPGGLKQHGGKDWRMEVGEETLLWSRGKFRRERAGDEIIRRFAVGLGSGSS